MGDIGHIDADGYLFLTDRKYFMIISGGVNIYPQEIENLIVTHPKVADVAVFGTPDEEMGERVVAVVQPLHWADIGAGLAEDLRAYVRRGLGSVKCPRQFEFRRSLPREPTGKLMKRLLQEEYRNATARREV
jgi:long-chain acyl-CoA synthetase